MIVNLFSMAESSNRTWLYLWPQHRLYGPATVRKLTSVTEVYLGNAKRSLDDFYVVIPKPIETDSFITEVYYDFSLKKHVAVVKMMDKYKTRLDYFWSGDYQKLYNDSELKSLLIFPTIGNKVNLQYHFLRGTEMGKEQFKKNLVAWRYVDVERFGDWEDFSPNQADFPAVPHQEVLHYDREDPEMAERFRTHRDTLRLTTT